jgi:hypothetical protein
MQAYNKKHASFRVQAEWGIGGLKRKWRSFMKRFDSITFFLEFALFFKIFPKKSPSCEISPPKT